MHLNFIKKSERMSTALTENKKLSTKFSRFLLLNLIKKIIIGNFKMLLKNTNRYLYSIVYTALSSNFLNKNYI